MTVKEIEFNLPHIRLNALQWGEGRRKVLALHGWLDNAMSFAPLAAELVDTDTSLLALELAGHGRSGHRPLNSGYHFSDYLRDVMQVITEIGVEPIDMIGHSLGGIIASLLAGIFPTRFASVVCIECYGAAIVSDNLNYGEYFAKSISGLDDTQAMATRVYPALTGLVRARLQAGEMQEENARRLIERNTLAVEGGYRFCSDKRLTQQQPMLASEEQVRQLLAGATAPILVIEGNEGFLPNWPHAQARYALPPYPEVVQLAGKHHVHMDNATETAATIRAFWQKHQRV